MSMYRTKKSHASGSSPLQTARAGRPSSSEGVCRGKDEVTRWIVHTSAVGRTREHQAPTRDDRSRSICTGE